MAKFYLKNYSFLDLDPGLVGLSLAYSITLTGMFQYCVRVSAEVENLVSSYSTRCGYEIHTSMTTYISAVGISGEGDGI